MSSQPERRVERDEALHKAVESGRDRSLSRLRSLARLLDSVFQVPFTRFRIGLDAVLGLVPGWGDAAGAVASAYIILQAARLGVPKAVLLRMVYNTGVEALVGIVPVLGDLFDAGWKANLKNVELLERYLERPGAAATASRLLLLGALTAIAVFAVGSIVLTVALFRALLGMVGS